MVKRIELNDPLFTKRINTVSVTQTDRAQRPLCACHCGFPTDEKPSITFCGPPVGVGLLKRNHRPTTPELVN